MTNILFVCYGNICRSPMAEFVMKDLIRKAGRETEFHIESAATSAYEIGNPVYPPAREKLKEHVIGCAGKTARQITKADYEKYDYIIGMDEANLEEMCKRFGGDPDNKLHMLMDYTDRPGEVADPWFTRDFDAAWRDIYEGCKGMVAKLMR